MTMPCPLPVYQNFIRELNGRETAMLPAEKRELKAMLRGMCDEDLAQALRDDQSILIEVRQAEMREALARRL